MKLRHVVLFLIAFAPLVALAGEVPVYTVYRAGTPIIIDGRLDEPAWSGAPAVEAFQFAWWREGKKEQTVAKVLWDERHLYVSYLAEDAHIWAEHTQRDSAVWQDDCVEVFIAPNAGEPRTYFNFEMNVLGALLDDYHPQESKSQAAHAWNGEGIRIATTRVGTLNDDSDEDAYWILEAAIPWKNFAHAVKHAPPLPTESWRLNLNRLGGKTNAQYSQWSPSHTDKPQFHVPEDFGKVVFSESASPFWRR